MRKKEAGGSTPATESKSARPVIAQQQEMAGSRQGRDHQATLPFDHAGGHHNQQQDEMKEQGGFVHEIEARNDGGGIHRSCT